MRSDEIVAREVGAAFGGVERPTRFLPDVGDFEFDEHDELLRARTVESITHADLRSSWDPLTDCSAQGQAYFFPAMVRIALEVPRDPWDWYAEQMLFHLTHEGPKNRLLQFCGARQRLAVLHFLEHLCVSRKQFIDKYCVSEDFEAAIRLWRGDESDA